MSVVEKIQGLLAHSRMFVAEDKLRNMKGKKPLKGRRVRELIKVGQGGTLDPLADGVLGGPKSFIRLPLETELDDQSLALGKERRS